jgi:hypothetical protein
LRGGGVGAGDSEGVSTAAVCGVSAGDVTGAGRQPDPIQITKHEITENQ